MATGAVAGLVGVTPAAGFVTPGAGMAIGCITALICYSSIQLKMRLRFDDSLDTFQSTGLVARSAHFKQEYLPTKSESKTILQH